ncbi:hypothetical protein J2Z42_002704 [Clostridium algifaecis]|uniref:Transposase n=1 Tax=Clostridium algifaecis TaxID=1472040 RepID=A0ABS4KVC7_9CLOT|nr:hypothetical protein [Clostridium algifaecis]MBP2033987.1 hypothetical protein [Clostridium algifaecis]
MNGIDWNDYSCLDELNHDFTIYLNEKYNNIKHSSLNSTPRNRYLQDMDKIKFVPTEDLENNFLHRVSRKVNNDVTIQLNTKQFEVPAKYIGQLLL